MKFHLKGDPEGVKRMFEGIKANIEEHSVGKQAVTYKLSQNGELSIIELGLRPGFLINLVPSARLQLETTLRQAMIKGNILATIEKIEG